MHANKVTVYYSPTKLKVDCMGKIEVIWLFQSKHTNKMQTKQLCTTHLLKLRVNCIWAGQKREYC